MSGPAWRDRAVLAAAGMAAAAGFAQYAVTASLGDVAEAFGAAGAQGLAGTGMTATTVGLGLAVIRLAAIGSLGVAALSDRWGRRTLLVWAAAIGLAMTSAAGVSPGFWWLVGVLALSRPLLSAVNAVAMVVAAEETSSAQRATAMAVVGGAYAVGSGVVSITRGLVVDALGWRGVFALVLIPLALMPLLTRALRETPRFRRSDAPATHRLGAVSRPSIRPLGVLCGVHAAVGLVLGPVYTYVFLYGEQSIGASPMVMAALVVAAGPTGLAGLLLGRTLADHWGRRPAAGGTLALGAMTSILAYSGGLTALVVGYLATVAIGAAYTPAAGAIDTESFPTQDRGTAAGWISAAQVIGQVVGLAGFGLLIDATQSFASAAMLLWALVPVAGLLYLLVPETRGRDLDDLEHDAGTDLP